MICAACKHMSKSLSPVCFVCGWDQYWNVFDIIRQENQGNGHFPGRNPVAIGEHTTKIMQAASMLVDHLAQLQLAETTQMLQDQTKGRVLRWSVLLLFELLQAGYTLDIPIESGVRAWWLAQRRGNETQFELDKIKW